MSLLFFFNIPQQAPTGPKAICRIGDLSTGTCSAHTNPVQFTGTWTTGSTTVKANLIGVIRSGDIGTTSCGHYIQATLGSGAVRSNGLNVVRVGDPITVFQYSNMTGQSGNGITTTGAVNVTSG